MNQPPERIWLREERFGLEPHEEGPWEECGEGMGVEYVRADRYAALLTELDALLDGVRRANDHMAAQIVKMEAVLSTLSGASGEGIAQGQNSPKTPEVLA